jgi:hypothetical protein
MLILEANKVCPHGVSCPYNTYNECAGVDQDRLTSFQCDYVSNGLFVENGQERSNLDQTGQMKIILE